MRGHNSELLLKQDGTHSNHWTLNGWGRTHVISYLQIAAN